MNSLEPVHVDAHLIVVDKPAGMLSVPGRGETGRDCLATRVQARWADARVVHRLDMATSGLMLFARGAAAQRALSRAFAERRIAKRYVAIVAGAPDPADGEIALPLAADWPNRPRQQVDRTHGKASLTRYRRLERDAEADTSRLRLEPVTGRSHQLRVHLAAIGHPILGDALYAPPAVRDAAPRLYLHATSIAFAHPADGLACRHEAAPPF